VCVLGGGEEGGQGGDECVGGGEVVHLGDGLGHGLQGEEQEAQGLRMRVRV
jgi:hypothetical protein